jgi:two-component system chemotaxis sensor kinase CheA
MATVRGSLLPVVRLHERFRLEPRWRELTEGMLVVVESEDKRFCLFVDELLGKQEVVIKGLGETFREIAGLAGCAILGDGRVGLILDPEGIFHGKLAGVA